MILDEKEYQAAVRHFRENKAVMKKQREALEKSGSQRKESEGRWSRLRPFMKG